MANIFVESFGTYGQGSALDNTHAQIQAMLAGRWASVAPTGLSLGQLPWDPSDTDIFFGGVTQNSGNQGARFVLPATTATAIISLYYAVAALPAGLYLNVFALCDVSNIVLCSLGVGTTGALFLFDANNNLIAQSSGPALVAESAAHIECSATSAAAGSCTFRAQVNGVDVINATGLTFTNANHVAQVKVFDAMQGFPAPITSYIGNLIVRDTTTAYNNAIVGDRRVATLFVNSDDPAHQGWTGHPLKLFGLGVLDLTQTAYASPQAAVSAAADSTTDIGASQFTIEGEFRLLALPSGSNKAVLFSKWNEPNNLRSYELYIGGPSLEAGNIVFRTSTDGTAGTVNELISWAYTFLPGTYYHIAVARDGSNNTRLFVNGVLQGLAVADAHTYYSAGSAGALAVLGGEAYAGGIAGGTCLYGWEDEFRLTIGACRYTTAFTPPVAAFPRGGGDASWAFVAWLSGWDSGSVADESSHARLLTAQGGAAALLPGDGVYNFQTMNKLAGPPLDNTFLEADLTDATNTFTLTAVPTTGATVTLATKDGTVAAVYTWDATAPTTAFHVLKGASIAAATANLAAAINAGAGSGTVYGAGTTANHDVSAVVLPNAQLVATALVPGTAGNALASTTTDSNGSWAGATLSGGLNIPAYSQFGVSRLPSNVTIVDSVSIISRQWKTDAGTCTTQASFIGGGGGVDAGGTNSITTTSIFYSDTFQTDPDTSGPLTPTSVINGKIRINRAS